MIFDRLRPHSGFLLLLLILLFVVRLYAAAIPTYEGPDETEHVAYILWLRQKAVLPNPVTDFETDLRQQASQSPLYYMLMAGFSHLLPFDYEGIEVEPAVNPWRSYPAPRHSPDNRNAFLMSEQGHSLDNTLREQITAVYLLRLISPLFGIVTLTAVYAAGMLLWNDRRWALVATIIVGFTPQLLQSFTIVNNDNAVIAFGALTITSSLYLARHPQSRYTVILAGVMMGFAALSKANGLLLWATPAVALIVGWRQYKRSNRTLLVQFGLLLLTAFLAGGWWYLRSLILYGDPLGVSTHQQTTWAAQQAPTITAAAAELPGILLSIWANFGWYSIFAPDWAYLLPLAAIVVGAVGWMRTHLNPEGLVLLITVVIGLLSLIAWLWVSTFVPGRLFLPFYPALVLLVVVGLRRFERLRFWWAGAFGALAVMIIPTTLYPAFNPPRLFDAVPENLIGTPLRFGEMEFLGYRLEDDLLAPNTQKLMTLCWRAPEYDLNVPYAFALHIPDADNRLIGGRDSYPGMGKYTRWQGGKSFCDRFYMPIGDGVQPTHVYPLRLTLYDVETQQELEAFSPDGTRTHIIGYVRTAADKMMSESPPQSYVARFGDITLLDAKLADAQFTLEWGVLDAPRRPLKVFIHLIDDTGEIQAQVDQAMGGENYPSWAWNPREQITDTMMLPFDQLTPGSSYRLLIGVYDAVTLERLSAVDLQGEALPNNALVWGTITPP